jgi:AAHS family 4-hydroxybenzoate transporter-like MFS transporter
MAIWLPESPRFLAARRTLTPRQAALLRRLDVPAEPLERQGVDIAQGNPVRMLFGEGYALQTALLWLVYFCSLMNLFLFAYWMPEVLHLMGLTPADSVFASSLRDCGAIFAVFYLGPLIDRSGPERALALHYAAGALFIAAIALVALPYALLLVATFFAGMTITGSQTGANGACGALYPARMRTTGLGWALGVGRLGGIAAPALGGALLAAGLPPPEIFLSGCIFALIAAGAAGLLRYRGARAARLAPQEAAS